VHNGHLPVGYSVWNVTVGLARTMYRMSIVSRCNGWYDEERQAGCMLGTFACGLQCLERYIGLARTIYIYGAWWALACGIQCLERYSRVGQNHILLLS